MKIIFCDPHACSHALIYFWAFTHPTGLCTNRECEFMSANFKGYPKRAQIVEVFNEVKFNF
jgi:hypothetical protein